VEIMGGSGWVAVAWGAAENALILSPNSVKYKLIISEIRGGKWKKKWRMVRYGGK
jgi:hypothetical protein